MGNGIQWTFLFIVPFALLIYPTILIYILLIKHNNDRLTPQDNIAKAKVNAIIEFSHAIKNWRIVKIADSELGTNQYL